jgi:glycerophosphoryl diester phosphodiesterase
MPSEPFVIAHAACKGHAPENTLAGLRAALDLGADGVEVDVQATADGVPVLLHDATVDRTTDGQGDLAKMTLAEVKRLDAGARQFEGRFAGEPVPTLAEALDLTRGRALMVLEVKQPDIEERVLRVVRDLGAVNDCVVHSFLPQIVARCRTLEPSLPAALLTNAADVTDWASLFVFALSLNAQGVSVFFPRVDAGVVRQAHLRKLAFFTWTVNEVEDMRRLRDCGVDAITTDYPDRLRAASQP